MKDDTPDYSKYNLEELEDVLAHINHDLYPDRVQLIRNILDDPVRFSTLKIEQEKLDQQRSEDTLKEWTFLSFVVLPELFIPKSLLFVIVLGLLISNKLFDFPSGSFRLWLIGLSVLVILVIFIIDPNETPNKNDDKHKN